MVWTVLSLAMRLFYLGVLALGLSLAASAYPPSGAGVPVTLGLGVLLALAGFGGVLWPEKMQSGRSSGD